MLLSRNDSVVLINNNGFTCKLCRTVAHCYLASLTQWPHALIKCSGFFDNIKYTYCHVSTRLILASTAILCIASRSCSRSHVVQCIIPLRISITAHFITYLLCYVICSFCILHPSSCSESTIPFPSSCSESPLASQYPLEYGIVR